MKIAFGMIVFNGNYVLKECLDAVYPFANQILIAEGPVKFWQDQGFHYSTDGTIELIDNYPDPEHKIIATYGEYAEKDDQCQAYMKYLHDDNDWLWNLDCDEVFKKEDIKKLISILDGSDYTSVSFKSCTFYGGFERYIGGWENNIPFYRLFRIYPGSRWASHRPPQVVHSIHNPLPEKHLSFDFLYHEYGIQMYHYSYVFPRQVREKILYYEKSLNKDGCIPDYYERVFKPWIIEETIARKQTIEAMFNGVHEFKPYLRGPTFTKPFEGVHPFEITEYHERLLKDL